MDATYDVFLSYSSRDSVVVRELAERLRSGGLRVWFDEWQIKVGDSIQAKTEEGLQNSRVLVLCMSAAAFGSDWPRLESYTFRFRDPLNRNRRFVPLRLDDTSAPGSLAQFRYIDWRQGSRDSEPAILLAACQPPASDPDMALVEPAARAISVGTTKHANSATGARDGETAQALVGPGHRLIAIALTASIVALLAQLIWTYFGIRMIASPAGSEACSARFRACLGDCDQVTLTGGQRECIVNVCFPMRYHCRD